MLGHPRPRRPWFAVLFECSRLGCATNTTDEHRAGFNEGTDCAYRGSRTPAQAYAMNASPWGEARVAQPTASGFTSRPARRRQEHEEPVCRHDNSEVDQKSRSSFSHFSHGELPDWVWIHAAWAGSSRF